MVKQQTFQTFRTREVFYFNKIWQRCALQSLIILEYYDLPFEKYKKQKLISTFIFYFTFYFRTIHKVVSSVVLLENPNPSNSIISPTSHQQDN